MTPATTVFRANYLTSRTQQCLVQCSKSSCLPVLSGVPQGSILGPLLFLVCVNDLPFVVDNNIALFADDSKCSKVMNSSQDAQTLQDDLHSLT